MISQVTLHFANILGAVREPKTWGNGLMGQQKIYVGNVQEKNLCTGAVREIEIWLDFVHNL
jgi:hypothetical protein